MSSARVFDYIDEKVLDEIIDVLNNDGLIIFPTDTVYGIACNSFSDNAIKKLYKAKNRSFDKPIGVLTDSISKIKLVVDEINNYEKELIDKYFPGKLTIVFNKKDGISDILTSNKQTIGVRIPNNEIALKILKAYPYPLATTSVNLSGCKEGTKVEDFINEFKNKVYIVIDGGKTNDTPSTIVRIENDKINIIRKGNLLINIGDNMKNIKTPEELLNFMTNNISYGYLGKNGKLYYYGDVNFDSEWEEQYILQNKEQVLNNLCGNCWDQVEFERDWFINNGYEVKTFYEMVLLDYKNEYPTHSFLTYKDNNKWHWFENSDFDNRGIHEFNSIDELLNYQYQKYLDYLKTFNIKDEEIKKIIVTEFTEPKENISSVEYINHVLKSKITNITKKKNISLYIPKIEDYWYEEKIQSDPLSMSYNAGYDVSYYGYHYDNGCIDFPKEKWKETFEKRIKENKYFAYIKDNDIDTFVGYVNYQYIKSDNRYECGIVIESTYRGKGYSKVALKLLCDVARKNGIKELYDNFEIERGNTLEIFENVGFEVVEEQTWKKFNKDVRGVLVKKVL